MKCPACGTENREGARFCDECGAALAAAMPSPSASAPPPIRAGESQQGERKLVTVLFADVAGFTTLAETLDPEPLRDLINDCFDRLVPCIERYGGVVDKYIGDEIMALFGAPVAHDNDPERAVRAALAMQEALAEFNRERGTDLITHLGLNTGLVLAGRVGARGRTDYSVMGDTVNVASRLAETAAPGEILIGPDTHRLTGHLFACQEAGSVRIRGRAEPLRAFRVLGPGKAPGVALTGRPGAGRWVGSPLVGRDAEKQRFVAALDRVLQGEGGILAVAGDAGLGKSRLTAEVRRLAGPELTWLEGRTLSFGRSISYWPFLELLQAAAGIDADDGEAERSGKLERLVGRLFAEETPDILPYLATLLALPIPQELQDKVRYLGGEAMGRQVFRTMRLFVGRLAREHPLVLVFEDVHWLDGSSVELLEHLLPLSREVPVLFCLVGRPEPDSPAPHFQRLARDTYADHYEEIALSPLSPEDTHNLVQNLVGLKGLPVGLRESIDRKAEGNPFFVEEIIRALIDLGGLVPGETGGWRPTDRAQEIRIPDTITGVIMARVDRLDEELKQVLRLAAVAGRSFFYRVLAALAEAETRLDEDLATLQALELVREKAREPELEYIFKHALVQEATYESILLQRRKELHQRVGQAIEELFADRLEEFYGLLAYHYTKAEDWAKAQVYLLRAGDQAGRIAADAEALAHYEQAIEAHAQVFGDTWDPFERGRLERGIGEALFRRGDLQRTREHLYRAMALFGCPPPSSSGTVRRALMGQVLRQLVHRLTPPRRLREPGPDRLPALQELAGMQDALLVSDLTFDPLRGLFDTVLLLNVFERAGYGYGIAKLSAGLGTACDFIPAPRLAASYLRHGLSLAEADGAADLRTTASLNMGMHQHYVGEWDAALGRYDRVRQEDLARGEITGWAIAAGMTCDLLLERGRLQEALVLAQESVRLGEESGDGMAKAWGEMYGGDALLRLGSLDRAESSLQSALGALLEATELLNAARTAGPLAQCLLRQGRAAEADAVLREAQERLSAQGHKGHFARSVHVAFAESRLLAAEAASGGERDRALTEAGQACRTALKNARFDRGGYPPAHRLQGTYEWLCGHERKAREAWQTSLAVAGELGARHQEAQTRLEMGRRLGDRTELEQAEAMFAEMGAAFDLAATRRLLAKESDEGPCQAAIPQPVPDEAVEPTARGQR